MEHLIFAAEAVMPTFILMLLGYGLKKRAILTEEFALQGDQLCFRFLFPILVFYNLYREQGMVGSFERPIQFVLGMIGISVAVGIFIVPRFVEDRKKIPVIIQSMYRGNFMLYGLPFSERLGGPQCSFIATAVTAVTLPVLNTIAIVMYAYYSGEKSPSIRKVIGKTITNPILWGIGLGFLFSENQWVLPDFLETVVLQLARTATPLAFLFLGARFSLRGNRSDKGCIAVVLLWKLLILPAISMGIAVFFFPMTSIELIPVFIFVAAPTAITTYQLAVQFSSDAVLARDICIYSLFFSVFTMGFFIFILRLFQLIG